MHRFCQSILAVLAVGVIVAGPSRAAAQAAEIDWEAELAEAVPVRDVGMGLTVAGASVAAVGLGVTLAFSAGGDDFSVGNAAGIIGGSVSLGLAGLLALAGVPTWIVGAVRAEIADADGDVRPRVAAYWETVGIAVFCAATGVAILGAGLLGGSAASHDTRGVLSGLVILPIGVFIAAFIGAPMWAEGASF